MGKTVKPDTKVYMSALKNAGTVRQVSERLEKGESLIVFDTETSGLAWTVDRVLSFSAIKMREIDGILREEDRMDIFINPGFHIPEAITAINHISDETVMGCDREPAAAVKIREFLGESPFLAGYNSITFDAKFMTAMYRRVFGTDFESSLHIDVHKLAKEMLPGLKSYKLADVTQELGTGAGINFHNSMDDVIATARNLQELLDMYKQCPDFSDFCALKRIKVKGARYWDGPNRMLKRVYVQTFPYSNLKTYYDCYYRRWVSDDKSVDLDAVRRDTLAAYECKDEKELVEKLKASQ